MARRASGEKRAAERSKLNIQIGKRVGEIIKESGVSSQSLCDLLDVSSASVSRYLSGERSIPVASLIKIADEYGTSVDYLVSGRGKRTADCPWH